MPWKVDKYVCSIREVSAKHKAEDEKWATRCGSYTRSTYFNTENEAVAHKRTQLETEITGLEKTLSNKRKRLAAFLKKFPAGGTQTPTRPTV